MKKFFKRVLKILGIFIALYLIVALFAPGDYKVERSKEMKASPEIIYQQVAFFQNWSNWSPWQEKDPSAKYKIEGTDGTVGAKYSWVGDPDLSGTGNLVITDLIENEIIGYKLTFEDWDMVSDGVIELESSENGTNVTWLDKGNISFLMRPIMLFMDLDGMIGEDFEKGLNKIDSISIQAQELYDYLTQYKIEEVDFELSHYYGIRYDTLIAAIDSGLFANAYGEIMNYLTENEIEMVGMPVSIAFEWNQESSNCVLMPAIPIASPGKNEGLMEAYTIKGCRALLIEYYGEYDQIGVAHHQMEEYLKENGLEHLVVLEEYVTDPTTVDSMDEVLTKIYYLLK